MFDDLERVRQDLPLRQLFTHYAALGEPNRDTWHNRLMQIDGLDAAELTRLHGELLALDWVELNVGAVPCSYRITLAGLRAYRQLQDSVADDLGKQAA